METKGGILYQQLVVVYKGKYVINIYSSSLSSYGTGLRLGHVAKAVRWCA
jgi:hypothetical protein